MILQYIDFSGSDSLGGSDSSENGKRRKLGQTDGDSAVTIKSKIWLFNP